MNQFYDPRARETLDKLREKLVNAADARSLTRQFELHPERGAMFRLLETLCKDSDSAVRLSALEVLAESYPDLPRTVAVLLRAAGNETECERFRRVVQLRGRLRANREPLLVGVLNMMYPHLQSAAVTFPLGESEREKEAGLVLSLSNSMKKFRKALYRSNTTTGPGRLSREEFRSLYARLVSELEDYQPRKPWRAPRTRKERIESFLRGEEPMTHDLFRVMTARDGFANLKQVLKARPEALRSYSQGLEIESALSDEQLLELWELMDEELRSKLGPGMVGRSSLRRSTLLCVVQGPRPVAEKALEQLALTKPESPERAVAESLLQRYPELEALVWKAFSSVLEPCRENFPRWECELRGSRAAAIIDQNLCFLSTPSSLTCWALDSGRTVWDYREDGLPLACFPLGERRFLGLTAGEEVCLINAGQMRIHRTVFQGESPCLTEACTLGLGDGFCQLRVLQQDESYQIFRFDLEALTVTRLGHPEPCRAWSGKRLFFFERQQTVPGLPCTPTSSVVAGPDHKIYAFHHSEGESPSGVYSLHKEHFFGFDQTSSQLTFRCWSRRWEDGESQRNKQSE